MDSNLAPITEGFVQFLAARWRSPDSTRDNLPFFQAGYRGYQEDLVQRERRLAFVKGMAGKKLGDAAGNGLWALHMQQVSHAYNPAVLDLWEPGMKQLVALYE